MNPSLAAYILATGWLGARLLTVLLETTGRAAYTHRQTNILRKLQTKKQGRLGKRVFSTNLDPRFKQGKDFNKNANAYLALNKADVIIPTLYIQPNQTLLGLIQEFDSLRQNNALILKVMPTPPYAIKRNKPLKKAREAIFADDLAVVAEPLSSYWQLAKYNFRHQTGQIKNISTPHKIRKSFIDLVLLFEPFMVGYFIYLAVALKTQEPLIMAFGITLFSLVFYVWADRQHGSLQKARLVFLAPIIVWFMYLLAVTRLFALIKTIALKTREDWAKWQPQAA